MEMLEEFVLDCRVRGYTKKTIESYSGHVRYFLEQNDYDCSFDDLKRFLLHLRDDRKLSLATIGKYFSSLSTFYDYLEFDDIVKCNHVPKFRKRYLRNYKRLHTSQTRQLISVEQMAALIKSVDIIDYQVMMLFLAKTGIRRQELISLDWEDISMQSKQVLLKPAPKRSNRLIFFDEETKLLMQEYQDQRGIKTGPFITGTMSGCRIYRNQVYEVITRYAQQAGLHNPDGHLHEKFTTHCFRHWFTTHLRRSGCSREFIQELRGDSRRETIDIYDHIETDELQAVYERHIPQLGVVVNNTKNFFNV